VDDELAIDSALEEELYRIAQEALNNSLKHARATTVTVQLRQSDQTGDIVLEVEDDGEGMEVEQARRQGGMGLTTMTERAESVGGLLSVTSKPGEGTRIRVEVTP
jgi:signal transduction histidine kinase